MCCGNCKEVYKCICTILGHSEAITRLVNTFEKTGSNVNNKSPGRKLSQRLNKKFAVMSDFAIVSPSKSVPRRSQQLRILSSLQRILKNDLHLYAYKVQ